MDEKNENQEMVELVLKSLLIEVFKDGQVEQSESDLINKFGSALKCLERDLLKLLSSFQQSQ